MTFSRVCFLAVLFVLALGLSSSVSALDENAVIEQQEEREDALRLLRDLRVSLSAAIDRLAEHTASPQLLAREDSAELCGGMDEERLLDVAEGDASAPLDCAAPSDDVSVDEEALCHSHCPSSRPVPAPVTDKFREKSRRLCSLVAEPVAQFSRSFAPVRRRLGRLNEGISRALSRLLPAFVREELRRRQEQAIRAVATATLAVLQLTALPLLSLLGETLQSTGGVLQDAVVGIESNLLALKQSSRLNE